MTIAKPVTKILDNQTVAASDKQDSSGVDLSSAIDFGVGYTLTFNADATAGASVELYADETGASDSFSIGTDDNPCDSGDINVAQGKTVSGFIPLLHAPKYVKVRIVNEDNTYSITGCSLWSHVQTA